MPPGTPTLPRVPDTLTLDEIYGEGAPTYDAIWAHALLPVTRRLVERLPVGEPRCVLDLGSGTGKALELLRAAAPRAQIVGLDRNRSMLAMRPKPFPAVQCDLARLCLRDGVAGAGLIAFALFHVGDPARALREAARVLEPRAVLGVAVWSERKGDPAMDAAWVAALERHDAPAVEGPPRTDELMDTPDKLRGLLLDAGFHDVETWRDAIEWRPTVEEFVTYRTRMGVFSRRYVALSPEAQVGFLADARAAIEAIPPDERVDRSGVVCAIATR